MTADTSRIERLHAHHLRHWLYGGRTDLANMVLLCDTDHGLVHDNDLVMSRTNGRLVVIDADGRRVWGTADAWEKVTVSAGDHTGSTVAAPDGRDTRGAPMTGDVDETFYVKPEGTQYLCSPADQTPQEPGDAKPDELEIARAIDAAFARHRLRRQRQCDSEHRCYESKERSAPKHARLLPPLRPHVVPCPARSFE